MKVRHDIAERIWKLVRPGHWKIGNRIHVNRGMNGNMKIWDDRFGLQDGDPVAVAEVTKHGGVVLAYESHDHGERRVDLSESGLQQLVNELTSEVYGALASCGDGLPAWANASAAHR